LFFLAAYQKCTSPGQDFVLHYKDFVLRDVLFGNTFPVSIKLIYNRVYLWKEVNGLIVDCLEMPERETIETVFQVVETWMYMDVFLNGFES